jgi:hypothetical protein
MIQRIQSLYLLFVLLLSLVLFKSALVSFNDSTGSSYELTFEGISETSGGIHVKNPQMTIPLSIAIILIPLLTIAAIMMFKNRKNQMLLARGIIVFNVLVIILSVWYSWSVIQEFSCEIVPGVIMAIPVIMIILTYLAYRGIKKDDLLVKSYDRLR